MKDFSSADKVFKAVIIELNTAIISNAFFSGRHLIGELDLRERFKQDGNISSSAPLDLYLKNLKETLSKENLSNEYDEKFFTTLYNNAFRTRRRSPFSLPIRFSHEIPGQLTSHPLEIYIDTDWIVESLAARFALQQYTSLLVYTSKMEEYRRGGEYINTSNQVAFTTERLSESEEQGFRNAVNRIRFNYDFLLRVGFSLANGFGMGAGIGLIVYGIALLAMASTVVAAPIAVSAGLLTAGYLFFSSSKTASKTLPKPEIMDIQQAFEEHFETNAQPSLTTVKHS